MATCINPLYIQHLSDDPLPIPYLSLLRDLDRLLNTLSLIRPILGRGGDGDWYFLGGGDGLGLLGDGLQRRFREIEGVEVESAGGDTEGSSFLSFERLLDCLRLSGDIALLFIFGGLTDLSSRLLSLSCSLEGLADLLSRLLSLSLSLGGLTDLLSRLLSLSRLADLLSRLSLSLSLSRLRDLLSRLLSLSLPLEGLADLLSRLLSLTFSLEGLRERLRLALFLSKGERLLDFFLDFISFGERLLFLSLLCFPEGERLLDFFFRCFFLAAAGDLLLEGEDGLGDLGIVNEWVDDLQIWYCTEVRGQTHKELLSPDSHFFQFNEHARGQSSIN